jgi:hypothetical protein
MEDSLSVEYIDGKRCYFYSSSISGGNRAEINSWTGDGKYKYMISFMDYVNNSGLVFRDWMLDIHRNNPVNEENTEGAGPPPHPGGHGLWDIEYHRWSLAGSAIL